MRKTRIKSRPAGRAAVIWIPLTQWESTLALLSLSHCQVTNSAEALISFLQVNPSKPCLNPDTCTSLATSGLSEV